MGYVVVEGNKLPTPYLTMDDAVKAMNALRSVYRNCCMDIVYE